MKNHVTKSFLSVILIWVTLTAYSQKKEERDVPSFSGIGLAIPADLFLTQGSPQKVVIEADENDLGKIETDIRDGVLQIKKEKQWSQNLKNVKIWITVPEVDALHLAGSGMIQAEKAIQSEELELKISGSGKIILKELSAGEVEAAISGSGDLILGGSAKEMDLAISGSGTALAQALKVDNCSVQISGSGRCEVDATVDLEAAISGSGKVTYYSNPVVNAAVSGSGKVKKGGQ